MFDIALKGIALAALASIAIGIVRWLLRHPATLLLMLAILGVAAWFVQ